MNPKLTVNATEQLREGIYLVLNRWEALRHAVEEQRGGPKSLQKAHRLPLLLFQRLTQTKENPYVDDLEQVLQENFRLFFNVYIENESIEKIAEKLRLMREECIEGNFNSIEKLKKRNFPSLSYAIQPATDDEDDSEADDNDIRDFVLYPVQRKNPNLKANAVAQLQEGIYLVLDHWSALRTAVEKQWGGPKSLQKSQRLAGLVIQRLTQSKENVYVEDLEELLKENFMLFFNVEMENGSIEEIAEMLVYMRGECEDGYFGSIKNWKKTNFLNISYVRKTDTNDDGDESEDDDNDNRGKGNIKLNCRSCREIYEAAYA